MKYSLAPCRTMFVLAGSLLLPQPSPAVNLLVYNNNNSGVGSLRQAVNDNNAIGGGNIIVFSNTVVGTISLASELVITTNVTIMGPGPDLLAVSGNNASRVFRITNNAVVSISGLRIVNGRVTGPPGGGGILNFYGTLRLDNCIVSNCVAQGAGGGGVDAWGPVTITRSSLINNQANTSNSGGALDGYGSLTNCTIAGNVGYSAISGGENLWSTTVAGNTGRGVDTALMAVGNSILADNTGLDASGKFTSAGYNLVGKGNAATGFTGVGDQVGATNQPLSANLLPLGFHGGPTPTMPPQSNSFAIDQGKSFGLVTDQRGRVRTFDDPTAFNATLGDGTDIGAVEARPGFVVELLVTNTNDAGPGSLRQAILHASSFEYDVIAFATNVTNTIRLTSGELVVNKPISIEGPGIGFFGRPPPWKLTISGNNASRVFKLTGGNASIYGLTIAHGAADQGAGILVEAGDHFIEGCNIVSNAAAVAGGGIFMNTNSLLSINYSSVSDNEAVYSGGGIAQPAPASLVIASSTIARNRTTFPFNGISYPHGGGISILSGVLYVWNSTVASNVSTYVGGGIANGFFDGTTASIRDSIIAGNSATGFGADVYGPFISGGYNLIGNTNDSAGFGTLGDQLNVNPLLGPLADYGGPTLTMALRAGSPAIDKGNRFGWHSDQRFFSRPIDDPNIPNASGGDGSDIGAFEVDPRLRIVDLHRVGSNVALSLTTVLGRSYRAEYTNNLSPGSWTIFTSNVPGNGHLLWLTNYGGANDPRRFYRGATAP
jgi:hypothetical protein